MVNNIRTNVIVNIVRTIVLTFLSFITFPWVCRFLGESAVGTYTWCNTFVAYFLILAKIGIPNLAVRECVKVRDDKEMLSKTFWSIYLFQLLMGIFMLVIYIVYALFISNYKVHALIEILFILSAIFDINWFFFGMEEFKKTITRNTFVKVGNLLLILLLVKSVNDLWKYTLIMAGMTCLSQLIMWGFLRKKIDFVKVSIKDITKHIKPNLILFIPVIAVSLYKIMDKVMLGSMMNVTEVGFYENAEKIINIPMTIITALGTVMLPRISNIIAKGDMVRIKEYISKSTKFVSFLSFAMCVGLICIGYNFAPLYFGESFNKTGILIMMLATTMPFIAFANVLRTQYLIPKEINFTSILLI